MGPKFRRHKPSTGIDAGIDSFEYERPKRIKYRNAVKETTKEVDTLVRAIQPKQNNWKSNQINRRSQSEDWQIRKFKDDKPKQKYSKKNQHDRRFEPQDWQTKLEDVKSVNKFKRPWQKMKPVPVPKEKLEKYRRGEGLSGQGIGSDMHLKKLKRREAVIEFAAEQAARSELLLTEESGFLVPDEGESTTQFTQKQIANMVDITSATKHFDLDLTQFGPYRMNYSRNGRHLLIGGKKGHLAAMDWVTKKLHCEVNAMEAVYDVRWLHVETMFAAAQKEWVYVYDNQGIEIHCVKQLNKVLRMEFLPYHFLLSTANEEGYLSWLDISIGVMVSQFNTKLGRLNLMTLNPYNAIVCLGHSKGIVTMWSPNVREPLCKMLCHRHPIQSLAIDPQGQYMATSGVDKTLKIWDIRKLEGPLQEYRLRAVANNLSFSQRNMLAVGMGNIVEIYRDCCTKAVEKPYIRHRSQRGIENMQFCPYEDVLGIGTEKGFTSLIIPGSGEPNFDALESNPFQTKSQRKEAEVKALLDKIQPEFITLDPTVISDVDIPTLKDRIEATTKLLKLEPPKVDFEPRKKTGRKKGTVRAAKTRKIIREEGRREFVKSMKQTGVHELFAEKETPASSTSTHKPTSVLDRFKPKQIKRR